LLRHEYHFRIDEFEDLRGLRDNCKLLISFIIISKLLNEVRILANMTALQSLSVRRALADKLPNYPNVDSGGNISLRRGIFQAVEVSLQTRFWEFRFQIIHFCGIQFGFSFTLANLKCELTGPATESATASRISHYSP